MATLLTAAWGTHAAGLGKLTVFSAIGQPLNAEVAIAATPEELASLSAKLASSDAFKEAGIEFMPALSGLRFSVVKAPNNQAVLKLTTERPLNEPFLHFLVEVNWASGRMAREYTFLLDPPEMLQMARPAPVVAPAAPVIAPITSSVEPPSRAGVEASTPPSPERATAKSPPGASVGEYEVKRGDTLSKIAREIKPDSVSLDQMLVALFDGNRDAFDGKNMNRLHAGKILRLPDPSNAAKIDPGSARKLVVAQAGEFNAYRRRLAGSAAAAPAAETAPRQQASGAIKPQVETKAPSAPAKDKLEVSRAEVSNASRPGGKLSNLEEDLIARDKALREAAGRIADLEKNLENLKYLVELKSQAGVQAQKQAQAAVPTIQAETGGKSAPKPVAPPAPVASPSATSPVTAPPAIPATGEKTTITAPDVSAQAVVKPVDPNLAPVPVDSPRPKPEIKKPSPPPAPAPSFVEENPSLVFGGGSLLALLLGYLGFSALRRRKLAREDVEASGADFGSLSPGLDSAAVFGAKSENVESEEVSIQGDFSEGGALTTEESVDPVAEADVYMAYGRDSQAEEILLEGMKSDPTRIAIHLKLLELYANRKSVAQFEGVADKVHALTGGRDADWGGVVALAQSLGLTGGLFASASSAVAKEGPSQAASSDVEPIAVASQATAEAVPITAESAQPAMAREDSGSLDFELDLGTTSAPAASPDSEPVEAKVADEPMSLDFDFDLDKPVDTPESPSPTVLESDVSESVADSHVVDFSIEIDDGGEQKSEVGAGTENIVKPADVADFDLDLGSGEVAVDFAVAESDDVMAKANGDVGAMELDIPVVVDAPAPKAAINDLDLDFDLDLDSGASSVGDADVAQSGSERAESPIDLSDISLDLDEATAAVVPVAETSKDGVDFDIDLPVSPEIPETLPSLDLAPNVGGQVVGGGVLDSPVEIELPEIDLPFDAVEKVVATTRDESLANLPDIDLDSITAPGDAVQPPQSATSASDDPEVATKLELAQAYEEMGDREGARELLNEVVSEGSAAQQAVARSRLEQLDI